MSRYSRFERPSQREELPSLLTTGEVADLLRTSKGAIYAMVERGLLPGVRRIGRRVLIDRAELVEWLDHNCAPSHTGEKR